MKKLFLPLLFFPLLAYCAQGTASASLTAGISLSEIQTMYFSSITVYGNCEIAMSPSGARVVTGEAVLNDEFNAPCRIRTQRYSVGNVQGQSSRIDNGH